MTSTLTGPLPPADAADPVVPGDAPGTEVSATVSGSLP